MIGHMVILHSVCYGWDFEQEIALWIVKLLVWATSFRFVMCVFLRLV